MHGERVRGGRAVEGNSGEGREDTGWCILLSPFLASAGLSDYELRPQRRDQKADGREAGLGEPDHWVAGRITVVTYRRNVAILDDDGKDVPGTKG
ncbi:hypothetical protein K438DRAFT_1996965 [Mycena galopus ATCC 62051]|nr:hypothetical protein K438DRAFT_1996965 [Mycena galopus ATCC 62051]